MFIGHFAVGFGAKRFAPKTSLGPLIAAPIFLDVLWPFFVLANLEQVKIDPGNTKLTPLDFVSYPYSHSLLMSVVWASLFAGAYYWLRRYWPGTIAIWLGVVSHWFLDFLVHRPDMPLYPGSKKLGLSLWNVPWLEVPIEILMLAVGVVLYARVTRAKDAVGQWAFWLYVLLLLGFFVGNLFTSQPPTINPTLIGAIVFTFLFILWAWWFDNHRTVSW